MCRKKWAVKNNFYNLIEHIRNFGDEDLIRHFQAMKKNEHLSKLTVNELVEIYSEFIEEKFLYNLVSAGEFVIPTDESLTKPAELNW